MAQDFARRRKPAKRRKSNAPRNRPAHQSGGSPWRWYLAGLTSGVFLCALVYLGTLPAEPHPDAPVRPEPGSASVEAPPKPRFDFYTMLPEQTIDLREDSQSAARPKAGPGNGEFYLLQAGSFRQRDDADRRRAELLLLGLEPRVEEASGDNGRWFRVYLGPFDSRGEMSRARGLTAAQDIDTLLLKRTRQ